MRCQTELGGHSAGSSRSARLDPLALPVRFTANDAVADEACAMSSSIATRDFAPRRAGHAHRAQRSGAGLSRRLDPPDAGAERDARRHRRVYLEHRDPALSIELYSAQNSDDVVAEWQLWSRVLGVPLLVAGSDGMLSEPFPLLGAVRFKPPAQRRRRRSAWPSAVRASSCAAVPARRVTRR